MREERADDDRAVAWARAIAQPGLVRDWTLSDWNRVVPLARRLRLLARLAESLDRAGLVDEVPEQARRHLIAEVRLSRWRTTNQVWMLECVGHMLRDAPYPLVLLKGSAYVGQDLPVAAGRLPSDVDILVPPAHVASARARLLSCGWVEADLDEHDRRYYLEWSHETPPMRHGAHLLELDLHHNILPPVGHVAIDVDRLLARLRPSRWPRWSVLDPVDQVLHSATHLFFDSELQDRLRDLVDLDGLLRHFGSAPGFWPVLPRRAGELGLGEPLALALHFCRRWLDTPVPADAAREIAATTSGRMPPAWVRRSLETVLRPLDADDPEGPALRLSRQLLLARYHYRRMPLRLLLPHLWHKATKRPTRAAADAPR